MHTFLFLTTWMDLECISLRKKEDSLEKQHTVLFCLYSLGKTEKRSEVAKSLGRREG
jgi:hypothetical protein